MRQIRCLARAILSLVPMLLASCVTSVHPLSDDETSKIDPRAYGLWQVDDSTSKDAQIFMIGKKEGSRNTLELVGVTLNAFSEVKVDRITLFLKPGEKNNYLSFGVTQSGGENDQEKKGYLLGKYQFVDDNTLTIWMLKTEVFIEAVKNNKLLGTVSPLKSTVTSPETHKQSEVKTGEEVMLTDTPDAIIKFLDENSEKCFMEPGVWRKLQGTRSRKPRNAPAPKK